jgi:outer membrane protein assembly factor BamB
MKNALTQQIHPGSRASACRQWTLIVAMALASAAAAGETTAAPQAPTDPIAKQLGVTRGYCAVLGDPKCELALRLARATDLIIYAQFPRAEDAAAARRVVDAAGLYGTRIYVDQGALSRLHLADNLLDGLVVGSKTSQLTEAEALRVLRPQAKAILGEKEIVKPVPGGLDDWSHPYHAPDNNPLSRDQVARAPYLTQFLADPRYAPLPQAAVAAGGRIFKAFGHIAFKAREEPWLNTLAGFNGYNGTLLWRRELPPALMVHRNTMIATATTLYYGDDKSCKVIDAATGELRDEIAPSEAITGGTFWKWMALEDGVLYAVVGEQEQRDPVIRAGWDRHGWPWNPLSPGFNQAEHPWGYGRTVVAMDPKTKKVLWSYQETEPIDCRALCLKNGKLFAFRHGSYLTCLDAKRGSLLWRKTKETAPDLFEAIGAYQNRQDWRTNWRTVAYLKANDQALYFAGPTVNKLLAVSSEDGHILWQHAYGNYQLILREDGVYGLSGQIDNEISRKFDPLTGKVLAEIRMARRACTRPTSSIDAIFCRADEGSVRLDMGTDKPGLVSPMRAQCHDGVTVANGLLYWWPSTCDCNLSLYGISCLGPAGPFDFSQEATADQRLEVSNAATPVQDLPETASDWPTFRANNSAVPVTDAAISPSGRCLWETPAIAGVTPTAPTAVGGLVFVSGSDGVVRALDAASGKPAWTAYTGGAVRLPPTIAKGRAYVGSGDGWMYAFEARTGKALWRFRAAPVERRIPVYGQLLSTWPAASGVVVEDGVAYVAAGIVNYDGTHVYALDAASGQIKWQNNTSGHLEPEARTGVSVQGHMVVADGKLFLAGGNAVSPAMYDLHDGKCLNDPQVLRRTHNNNVPATESPRGWELYRLPNRVAVSGKPYYSHPQYPVLDSLVLNKTLIASTADRDLAWVDNATLRCFTRIEENRNERLTAAWKKGEVPGAKPLWEAACKDSVAMAVGRGAVLLALPGEVVALDLRDGRRLWAQPLAAKPLPWGMAVDRDGHALVSLENGQLVCVGRSDAVAARD